jgi:C1A family cysteine protease
MSGTARSDRPRRRPPQRFGWLPDLPDARDLRFSAAAPVLAALPKSIDLRPKMPGAYDQGELGSCTANAIAAAFEYEQTRQGLADFMPSRLFIYYNEREIEGTVDTDSGAMIRDGIKSIAKLGVCSETTWPYEIARFKTTPPETAFAEAMEHTAAVYRRVSPTLDQLRGCLASRSPIVFGFSVYESFESARVARSGVVSLPADGEPLIGGHAVLAVGYEDRSERFLVRNSWGPDWGRRGYFSIPYDYLTNSELAGDFWAIYAVAE